MLFPAAVLLLVSSALSQELVQLEVYEDALCTTLNGTKPYAFTGVCQNGNLFMNSMAVVGLTSNMFTCDKYTAYPFEKCSTSPQPNTDGSTNPPTPFAPPAVTEFAHSVCRKSENSNFYYKFSCVLAQVATKIETFAGTCENALANFPVQESYFIRCANRVDLATASLSGGSDKFTVFGSSILQHESWSSELGCPNSVSHSSENVTMNLCVAKDGTDAGSTQYKVLGSGAAQIQLSAFVGCILSFAMMSLF